MEATLPWVLERARRHFQHELAVIDGPVRFTYGELADRVGRLGGGLVRLGVGVGDRVGVLSRNSHRHLECWLGIPRIGAVINDLDVCTSLPELAYIVQDSGTAVLIVDDDRIEEAQILQARCSSVRRVVHAGSLATPADMLGYEELLTGSAAPPADVVPDALAALLYSGGDTCAPKGVMLSHANLTTHAKHMLITSDLVQNDRCLHGRPMFDIADSWQTVAATWVGATHVVISDFDQEVVAATVESEAVTVTVLSATTLRLLIESVTAHPRPLESLRRIIYTGRPLPDDGVQRARDLLDCEVWHAYESTEAGGVVTCEGVPIVGTRVEVRPSDNSMPDSGLVGDVWVQSPTVMLGYWNRPRDTDAVLTRDGWCRTGDAGTIDAYGQVFVSEKVPKDG